MHEIAVKFILCRLTQDKRNPIKKKESTNSVS